MKEKEEDPREFTLETQFLQVLVRHYSHSPKNANESVLRFSHSSILSVVNRIDDTSTPLGFQFGHRHRSWRWCGTGA